MPELVCDTSALIALHQVGMIDVLSQLAAAVIVPSELIEISFVPRGIAKIFTVS